jgi:rare lipoprotein A
MRNAAIAYLIISSSIFGVLPDCSAKTEAKSKSKEFSGMADYYHHKFYGKKTASGEILQAERLTAAHRTLPFGTKLKVTNKATGHSCIVVINDRGPFTKGKVIDLSHAAAKRLGVLNAGTALVACRVVDDSEANEAQTAEDDLEE